MAKAILGISAYYHDSAAAILIDGQIVAAAQEERFSRIKHDSRFPAKAVSYVLSETGIAFENLSAIVFYEKPILKFERLLETYHAFAPKGLASFVTSIPVWLKDKLFMKRMLKKELERFGKLPCPISFSEHHLSHAASAFFPSPFDEAAILTIDGVGEWATAIIGRGKGNKIKLHKEMHFPHSVGLLYSAFTYYAGFRVNSGEYKLMGLAPYGQSESEQTIEFKNKILTHLIDLKQDGSILLNMNYFDFATGLRMTNNPKWEKLFGIPPRVPESRITQDYSNLALAIQQVTEEIVFRMAKHARQITGLSRLVLAGGVALNCVANGKLLQSGIFEGIWVQPASGDCGGALGAALSAWHIGLNQPRKFQVPDAMSGAQLGPEFSDKDIQKTLRKYNINATFFSDFNDLASRSASLLTQGKILGWFQGRMEFGPRALGNRSILGDARNPEMQKRMNLKIKLREGFRPFAPVVAEEDVNDYFEMNSASPYMLFVSKVKHSRCFAEPPELTGKDLMERLYFQRSDLPAITHIDYSARVQTVNSETNPRLYQLLKSFKKLTETSTLVNTSFNVRGEPIVCSPDDAIRCFLFTEMDDLVLGNFMISKKDIKKRTQVNPNGPFALD